MVEFDFKDGHCVISERRVEIAYKNKLSIFKESIYETPSYLGSFLLPSVFGLFVIYYFDGIYWTLGGATLTVANLSYPWVKTEWLEFRHGIKRPDSIDLRDIESVSIDGGQVSTDGSISESSFPTIFIDWTDGTNTYTTSLLFYPKENLNRRQIKEIICIMENVETFFESQDIEVDSCNLS